MTTIGVIGAGAWGTALSVMLANEERDVLLFGRDPEVVEEINTYQTNSGYLPGCALPSGIVATEKLDEVAKRDVVLCVVPAQSFHAIKMELRNKIGADTRLVLCAKGIDRLTGKFLHELASDILPDERISALSGPSFAADVAMAKPTAVTLAGGDEVQTRGPWEVHWVGGPTGEVRSCGPLDKSESVACTNM